MMKKKLTLDEYMSARPIADPIHLFDCVMPCAGAEGPSSCAAKKTAASLGLPERSHPVDHRATQRLSCGSETAARRLGARCRRTVVDGRARRPSDVDFVETYDDYPVIIDDAVRGPRLLRQGRRRRISCARTR